MPTPIHTHGIDIWLLPGGANLRVEIEPTPSDTPAAHPLTDHVNTVWQHIQRENPRAYDGPILSVTRYDPDRQLLTCRRDSYKWLAVQDDVATGVHQLGVVGIVTARDSHNREHVLLGRRGTQTRRHGGLWEFAPCGGLEPPHDTPDQQPPVLLDRRHIASALAQESREELGLTIDWTTAPIIALYRDNQAHNDDLVATTSLPHPIDPTVPGPTARPWEYPETRWLPLADLPRFDKEHGAEIRPPTRAIMRVLGWTNG